MLPVLLLTACFPIDDTEYDDLEKRSDNSPPVLGLSLVPEGFDVTTGVECQADVSDEEGDEVLLGYSWELDGEPLEETGAYLDAGQTGFARGAELRCRILPFYLRPMLLSRPNPISPPPRKKVAPYWFDGWFFFLLAIIRCNQGATYTESEQAMDKPCFLFSMGSATALLLVLLSNQAL